MITLNQRLSRLLIVLSCALAITTLRCGFLATWGHRQAEEKAKRGSARIQILPAQRGEIIDRYGICLATNTKAFRAGILYSQLASLPKYRLVEGKKVPLRAAYIEELAEFLSREIDLSPDTIEDTIYAIAAQNPNKPYLFAKNLSEKCYARLRGRIHAYPGLIAEQISQRTYPYNKVGSHVIGYTTPLGRGGWDRYNAELRELKRAKEMYHLGLDIELPRGHDSIESIEERLAYLKEKFQTHDAYVGGAGLEKQWDEQLRGCPGKVLSNVDAKGDTAGESTVIRAPKDGERVQVSLSIELQKICEELLIDHEKRRRRVSKCAEPWIKGGAIAAIEVSSGNVVALASTPRFDPNDFVSGEWQAQSAWLESSEYLASLWDRRAPLRREVSGSQEESLFLSWSFYLHMILPETHPAIVKLNHFTDITSLVKSIENRGATDSYDENLFLDLAHLAVDVKRFTPHLAAHLPKRSIDQHFKDKGHFQRVESFVRDECKALFHETAFAKFREESGKAFLQEIRKKERENKRYARPYTAYFRAKEKELFEEFWQPRRLELCAQFLQAKEGSCPYTIRLKKWADETLQGAHGALEWARSFCTLSPFIQKLDTKSAEDYLGTLTCFDDIKERPLFGTYPHLRSQTAGGLALAFYPKHGCSYMQSRAFQLPTTPGSLFKLAIAQAALEETGGTNPMTMVDLWQERRGRITAVGKKTSGALYPRWYKGGRLPKSSVSALGKIDLERAIALTSNPYFSILCVDVIPSTETLLEKIRSLGFGEPTGIDLPFESSGYLPCDLSINQSGLYAFAIGQHTTTSTPIQIAQMLRLMASETPIAPPRLGHAPSQTRRSHHKPLQTGGIEEALFEASPKLDPPPPLKGPLSKKVRAALTEGMRQVVQSTEGTGHPSRIRLLPKKHPARQSYERLFQSIIGKTSTAEVIETHSLDQKQRAALYHNTWFGGISYAGDKPELAVVVFLPHGTGGKEGGPLMARVVEAYRELESKNAMRDFSEASK